MEGPVGGTPEAVVQGAFDALRQWHGAMEFTYL
jgi:hypothetical protein